MGQLRLLAREEGFADFTELFVACTAQQFEHDHFTGDDLYASRRHALEGREVIFRCAARRGVGDHEHLLATGQQVECGLQHAHMAFDATENDLLTLHHRLRQAFGGYAGKVQLLHHWRRGAAFRVKTNNHQRSNRGPNAAPTTAGTSIPSTYHTPQNGTPISGQCRQ